MSDDTQKEREKKKALEDARHQEEKARIKDERDRAIGQAEAEVKVALAALGLSHGLIATLVAMVTAAVIAYLSGIGAPVGLGLTGVIGITLIGAVGISGAWNALKILKAYREQLAGIWAKYQEEEEAEDKLNREKIEEIYK